MRNGRRLRTLSMPMASNSNCLSKKSGITSSTEDLWAEDAYLPEQYIVSSPPSGGGFRVTLSTIQPEISADFHNRKYFAGRPKIPSSLSYCEEQTIHPVHPHRCFNEGDYLLEPPNAFKTTPTSSDIEDNTSFHTILTSLQGLADSISADFDTSTAENPEQDDDNDYCER